MGCLVDVSLLKRLELPLLVAQPTLGDLEDNFERVALMLIEDAANKRELEKQIDTCNSK